MMFNQMTVFGLAFAAAFAPSAFGQTLGIQIDTDVTAFDLVEELVGTGVQIRNIVLTAGGDAPVAIFTDDNVPSTFGFARGIILSTGTVNNVKGPQAENGNPGRDNSQSGDTDLDNEFFGGQSISQDAAVLEFEFRCPPDTSTGSFSFGYVFGSEEYNEFVDSTFNDAFAFFLDGTNIALLDNGAPVSINTVNCGRLEDDGSGDFNTSRTEDFCQELFVDNTGLSSANTPTGEFKAYTRFDGFTKPIFTDQNVDNYFHRLKIVIADASDGTFDSAVLLGGKSLVCEGPKVCTSANIGSCSAT
jgi:hypothetical protein